MRNIDNCCGGQCLLSQILEKVPDLEQNEAVISFLTSRTGKQCGGETTISSESNAVRISGKRTRV